VSSRWGSLPLPGGKVVWALLGPDKDDGQSRPCSIA
jgi:hypothetical protein